MKKVTFYKQGPEAPILVGTITLRENGLLVAVPASSVALRNVLGDPIRVPAADPGEPPDLIDPSLRPKDFIDALPQVYSGTYFWAEPSED